MCARVLYSITKDTLVSSPEPSYENYAHALIMQTACAYLSSEGSGTRLGIYTHAQCGASRSVYKCICKISALKQVKINALKHAKALGNNTA